MFYLCISFSLYLLYNTFFVFFIHWILFLVKHFIVLLSYVAIYPIISIRQKQYVMQET